jgi:phage-related minor tail protein
LTSGGEEEVEAGGAKSNEWKKLLGARGTDPSVEDEDDDEDEEATTQSAREKTKKEQSLTRLRNDLADWCLLML